MKNNASWKEGLTPLPSPETLLGIFDYDPLTGSLRWSKSSLRAGREAGCKQFRKDGAPNCIRVGMQINGRLIQFVAHRIIFQMLGITVPEGSVIDHEDDNPFNNALRNLRIATHAQNLCNQTGKKSRTLPKGVYESSSGRFYAFLSSNGVTVPVGTFDTPEQAKIARMRVASLYHKEFARA